MNTDSRFGLETYIDGWTRGVYFYYRWFNIVTLHHTLYNNVIVNKMKNKQIRSFRNSSKIQSKYLKEREDYMNTILYNVSIQFSLKMTSVSIQFSLKMTRKNYLDFYEKKNLLFLLLLF